jgi:hypothetical protein
MALYPWELDSIKEATADSTAALVATEYRVALRIPTGSSVLAVSNDAVCRTGASGTRQFSCICPIDCYS